MDDLEFYIENGFDPWDSSFENYCDEYEGELGYRFFEQHVAPRRPVSWKIRAEENDYCSRAYVGDDGFLTDEYYESDVFAEKKSLIRESLERRIVRDMNRNVNNEVMKLAEFELPRAALEKAHYLANEVHEVTGEHYDSFFRILGDENGVKDIDVPKFLTVGSDDYKDRVYLPERESEDGLTYLGTGASLADKFPAFVDEEGMAFYFRMGVQATKDIDGMINDKLEYLLSIIVNENGDPPCYVVWVNKPHYYYEDGAVKRKYVMVKLENETPEKYPKPKITGESMSEHERRKIKEKIHQRLHVVKGGVEHKVEKGKLVKI